MLGLDYREWWQSLRNESTLLQNPWRNLQISTRTKNHWHRDGRANGPENPSRLASSHCYWPRSCTSQMLYGTASIPRFVGDPFTQNKDGTIGFDREGNNSSRLISLFVACRDWFYLEPTKRPTSRSKAERHVIWYWAYISVGRRKSRLGRR
jgi:hypothetical protein